LNEAVELALRQNPRLGVALEDVEFSKGKTQLAESKFYPRLDTLSRFVSVTPNLGPGAPGPTGGLFPNGPGPYSAWQSELQLSWTLYDFGRRDSLWQQSRLLTQMAELRVHRLHSTIASEVTLTYLLALEAQAVGKIAQESTRRAEAILEDAKGRVAGGVALKEDVLRAEVQLSEARETAVRAEEASLSALARLNHAMGRDAQLPIRLADEPAVVKFTGNLTDCLRQAAESRPEIELARDRIAHAELGRKAIEGEYLPRLSLRSSLGYVDGSDLRIGWQEGVGVHLDFPLYTGGSKNAEVRSADAAIRRAHAEAREIANEVSLEVTLALRAVVAAQKRIDLAHPAIEQSQETLRTIRNRYRNGTATPTDVVDAETTLTKSQLRYASARIGFLAALAKLAYAIGEGPAAFFQLAERRR
jgi:outer membrane protein TolC